MSEYIFTYQTKCLVNDKTYVGVHKTDDIDDGYIGCGILSQSHAESSKRFGIKSAFHDAVLKYGYENFVCEPLDFFDTWDEALNEESELVDRGWVEDNTNYNITTGGVGGSKYCTTQEEEDIIFEKFMSGMKKEDIANEHDISVSVIYRITKDRDTTDRIIPLPSHIEKRNKWIEENKEEYIERYINGESQESLNKEAPHDLIRAELFKDIEQKPKYVCILDDKCIKFNTQKEISEILEEDLYIAGILECVKGKMSNYKGYMFISLEDYEKGKRDNGYVKDTSTHYKGRKLYKNGKEYTIETNLSEFCRKHDVLFASVQRLLNGDQKTSYGFTLDPNTKIYKHKGKKFYKDNKEYIVETTLAQFARDNDLKAPNLHGLINGNLKQVKGFTYGE